MTGIRLTRAAAEDVATIVRESGRMFGPLQQDRYAGLIKAAIAMVTEAPCRVGSWDRPDIAQGIRSFHIEHAAGRRGAASHVLFYRCQETGIIVLRILHQGMDAGSHVS